MLPSRRRLPGLLRRFCTAASTLPHPHRLRRRVPTSAAPAAAPDAIPRSRALDHAVEKEKHLLPFHNLKTLLLSSHPAPLPLSSINTRGRSPLLPFRPLDFIRLYPHAFLLDPQPAAAPLLRASPALLSLHSAEKLACEESQPDSASRLLRLLMLTRRRAIPVSLLDRLRWDLGLPPDFPLSAFPHYFRLTDKGTALELVCYNRSLAVSAMERYAARTGGYVKSAPLSFPLAYPTGLHPTKAVEEFQKLPYISPYQQVIQDLDNLEKWTVGMVHELLSLTIGKKTEKENLKLLASHVGLRAGAWEVIESHPGIFYVSRKLGTKTVVLREGYRRHELVEKHPLMEVRNQYIHLMNKHKREEKEESDRKRKRREKTKKMSPDAADDGDSEYDEQEEDGDNEEEDGDNEEENYEDSYSESDDDEDEEAAECNASWERVLPRGREFRRPIDSRRANPRGPSTSLTGRKLQSTKDNINMKQNRRANYRGGMRG